MRSLVGIGLLSAGVLVSAPAAAQDVEALRQELQQMRKQFETMKDSYEKAMSRLGERIQQLERARMGGGPVHLLRAVGVPALPARLQAYRAGHP
jgi:hypothetical protein